LDDNQGRANEASEKNATNESSNSDAGEKTGSTLPEATSQMTIRARDTATGHCAVANPNGNGNSMSLAQPSLDDDLHDKDQMSVFFDYLFFRV
jgi:hypothetical protein